MVSIMVNKLVYKPSVKDIMDKYYEMFRDSRNQRKSQKNLVLNSSVFFSTFLPWSGPIRFWGDGAVCPSTHV